MDDVKRLKAEYDAACEATRQATIRENEARAAYRSGLLEASGLAGHMVEFERRTWKKSETIRFVVERVGGRWNDASAYGRIVKKDGKLGTREVDASLTALKDLGVFKEPA